MEQSYVGSEVAPQQTETVPQASVIVAQTGWSWGAFMFNAAFLIGVKRYKLLLWYLLALIPFVNIVFMIGFMIYLGLKGYGIAAAGTQFTNQSEYDGFMKGVDHAGKILFFAMIIFIGIGLILGFANLAFFLSSFKFSNTPPPMPFPTGAPY